MEVPEIEVIILAGGFGTRLKSRVKDIPKPMAKVNGKPFLNYILDYLVGYNTQRVVFSLYYKANVIKQYFKNRYKDIEILYSIDHEAFGTGGSIKTALLHTREENVIIINGDTFFQVYLNDLLSIHIQNLNDITMSLKPMQNIDRYGSVKVDGSGRILSLKKQSQNTPGLIDGGVYIVNRRVIHYFKDKTHFSFNDFINNNIRNLKIGSMTINELFIDIGVPEDYDRAQELLRNKI